MSQKLISKIQYSNFEPGEFIDKRERNYDEVIALVKEFPWEDQRKNVVIDLTVAAITLQVSETNYLKMSLYFNQKFILYFFDGKSLYSKSFTKVSDTFNDIRIYFNTCNIDSTFKKENILFKALKPHFSSQDFIYKIDKKNLMAYLDWYGWLFFPSLILSVVVVVSAYFKQGGTTALLIMIFLFFALPLMGGINLLLCRNYYRFSKGKVLQLSRGAYSFKYGDKNNPTNYKKADIEYIEIKRNDSTRCGWNNYTLTMLYMKNKEVIKIPSIFLDDTEIRRKIPSTKHVSTRVWIPFI